MKSPRPLLRRGSALLELVLAGFFILVPLTIGLGSVGVSLVRSVRVFHFSRDAGHMFAKGIDFSQAANRALLLRLANGLDISDHGGNGVLILSRIRCTAAGRAVCTHRYVIGNAALRASLFANPTRIGAGGDVDYAADPAANASSFLSRMPMSVDETAYVVETWFASRDLDWSSYVNNGTFLLSVF